tara:strand:+ start:1908 stop:7061 length:5154 start_codon:yes stop_codon:yes gene_type:complete
MADGKRELVDKETGISREVSHDEVQGLVDSGRYELTKGPLYDIQLPGGDIEKFEASDATQLLSGKGRYLSPSKAASVGDFKSYGNSPITAAAASVLDYGTMGIGPSVLSTLSPGLGEDFQKIEKYNSGVYHGVGIVGSVAAAIGSGGTSLMAQGLGGAARAKAAMAGYKALRKTINPATKGLYTAAEAKAALGVAESAELAAATRGALQARKSSTAEKILLGKMAPGYKSSDSVLGKLGTAALHLNAPAMMNRAGAAAGHVVSDFVTKHGSHAIIPGMGKSFAELAPLTAKLTSGVSSLVADGAVQGGLYGAGEGLSEVALGDIDNAAEHIISTMGMNAMYGAAGGAGFGLGIPFIGKTATGLMKASGGLYGYLAKSAVSKAMTNSLARVSHALNKDLREGDLEELMLLFRLDDVGKIARNDMMELAKRIDKVGGNMTSSAKETFLIEEILQQADKNGVKFDRIRDLVSGSNVPAIEVLTAFQKVMNKTIANAEGAVAGNRNNKEELEIFFREWADASTLDNLYGVKVEGYKGQQQRGAAVVRKWATTEGEDVQRGMARVLSDKKLNKFFGRMVDWLHVGNVKSQEARIAGQGVITDQEHRYLDNYNRLINKNIEYYETSEFLTPSERSDLIASLNKARNSGDLSETREIIEKLKGTNRHQYTGGSKVYGSRISPELEYLDPTQSSRAASSSPIDPESVKVSKETQKRIDTVQDILKKKKRNVASIKEENVRLEKELSVQQGMGPNEIHSPKAHQNNIDDRIDELESAINNLQKEQSAVAGLERELKKINPGKTRLSEADDGPVFSGERERLEELRDHFVKKIGPLRVLIEDKGGKKTEKLVSYRGDLTADSPPKHDRSPEHRLLLDKKMENYSSYEMDATFPQIKLTPTEYDTLKLVDKAIKEGKEFLDEVGLQPSRFVNEWEALPKLTQRQIGLRNYPGIKKPKSRSADGFDDLRARAESDVGTGVITNKVSDTLDNIRTNVGDDAADAYETAAKAQSKRNLDAKMGKDAPTEDTVRLYRAEPAPGGKVKPPPDWMEQREDYQEMMKASGRWFTDDLDEARWYLKNEYPDGQLSYIDVPASSAEKYRVSGMEKIAGEDPKKFSRRPEIEFFLPKEIAARKSSFSEATAKVDMYTAEGNEALESAVKAARLKLNTRPETLPRSAAVTRIEELRSKGDIQGVIDILNQAKIKGLNAADLQAVVWDEMQTINSSFHGKTMANVLDKATAESSVDTMKAAIKVFLKNESVFGDRMSAYKIALSDDQLQYTQLQDQFRSLFGMARGTREYIDPDKLTDWITGLKHREAMGDIGKIEEHAVLGQKMVSRILNDFDIDNMDFRFSGVVQDLLKEMGITKTNQSGVWRMGSTTLGSKQVLGQLKIRLGNSAAKSLEDLDFVDKTARSSLRWAEATAGAANIRGLIRPSSFMGYFSSLGLGMAMNVVESISDPRLGIARLHALETIAEQGRKELDLNLDNYINYLATGHKAQARIPRSMIGPVLSGRDSKKAERESKKRERYKISEQEYDEAKDFLILMSSDPAQMKAFTQAATKPLGNAAPEARAAMENLLSIKVKYMHKMLPGAARGNLFDMAPRPSTMQMARFARVLEAVEDPVGAMAFALTEGTLTREVIEAISATSPSVFEEVRARLIEKLSDQDFSQNIGRQDKMMLAGMFNIPVVNGRLGKRLRENVRPGEKPGPEKRPKPMDTKQFSSPMDLISGR